MSPRRLLPSDALALTWRLVLVAAVALGVASGAVVEVGGGEVSSEAVGDPCSLPSPLDAEEGGEKEVEEVAVESQADDGWVAARWSVPPTAARASVAPEGPAPPPPRA